MKTRANDPRRPSARRRRRAATLALLAALAGPGCGREFFREWANQDVSEAIFEKSRDPRWRVDAFSVDPPWMSRFADPYDPDFPAAPPDDYATQALSPVPQWSYNRLIVPAEGTGYLKMLEEFQSEHPVQPRAAADDDDTPEPIFAIPRAPATPGGSPFAPPASEDLRTDPLRTPRIPGDRGPRVPQDLSGAENPRPDLGAAGNAAVEARSAELIGLLGTGKVDFDEAEAIGLPPEATPYKISMAQALTLALVNARVYQFQLEQLYIAALPVTLQRFTYTPQFIAGLSPLTGTLSPSSTPTGTSAGLAPAVNPANVFSYRTRATGLGQQSLLNIGTVAAVGRSFDMGAKVLAGFASQIVFNFTGVNPRQPTVQGYLPIQAFVPFLRGGGRAVTLEGLTLAERQLLYQIRTFARFRQEFLITSLLGGSFLTFGTSASVQGFSSDVGGNLDPTIGYINVVEDIALVENNARNVRTYEQFFRVYKELIKGESSGLTQLQLDQLDSNLQNAKTTLLSSRNSFRNDLDSFKLQIGLPPDTPLMVDRRLTQRFKDVYNEIEAWSRKPGRRLSELDFIAAKLPELEDVQVDGRSCLSLFDAGDDDNLEDLLLAAERVSLENRLDLMNYRAQLYDAWRQIRVTANALKGVFNVTVTNQNLTPVGTTNPFAFLDQAKQFSLVLNAELPLVRMVERNNFRSALINYQRQRRQLMFYEDYQKLQLRSDIRSLQVAYLTYQISKRNFVLQARLKDQAFENIVAPPQSGGGGGATGGGGGGGNTGTSASAATQTNNLIQAQNSLIGLENSLVTQWYQYQGARLTVYRDLGTLPYDEWEAFYEIFPSEYRGLGAGGRGYASPINAPTPSDPNPDRPGSGPAYGSPAPGRP